MKAILKYPVFVFRKRDNMVYVFYTDKDMKVTNFKIFQSTNFSGRIIIDSSGCKYTTESACITKYSGLWGYTFRMQGKVLTFEYEYENEVASVTLDELKEMILERYPKSRWFKSAWVDVTEFKEEMDKCQSFGDVALLFRRPPSTNAFLRFWRGY